MSLPVMQFPILSFDQANPGLTAASNINQTLGQIFQNQQRQIQNQFLPEQLKQANLKSQYENALLGPQAAQGQQRAAAQLALMQAQPQHMQAETQELLQGRIPEDQAHAGLMREETKYMPLKYAIEASNSTRQNSRFGDAFQFSKLLQALPPAQRAAYISEHPDEYQNLLNTMGDKSLQAQMGKQQDLLSGVMNKYFPQNEYPTPQSPQSPTLGQIQGGQATQPEQSQQQPQMQQPQPEPPSIPTPTLGSTFRQTPEQMEKTSLAFKYSANNANVGSQQRRRADAAVSLEKWLMDNRETYAPMIENATKFAGVIGKGESIADAISQTSPQAYTDYKTFKTSFVPNLANQMRMQEAMGATDQQTGILDKMYQAGLDIDQNPQGAKKMINDSIKMTQAIGDSVFQGAEPIHKGIHRKLFGIPKVSGDYTDLPDKQTGKTLGSVANEDKVRVQLPDGRAGMIPKSNLDKAVKAGAKLIQ